MSLGDSALQSTSRYQIVDVPGSDELSGVLADGQRVEVRLPAFDLGPLPITQVVLEKAALGLDDEVQPLHSVFFHQHRPVRVVGAERRRNLEPAGQLCIDLHSFVLFQLLGKRALDSGRVLDHLFINRLVRVQQILEVPRQFLNLEEFLRIVLLVADALIPNAVNKGEALGSVD